MWIADFAWCTSGSVGQSNVNALKPAFKLPLQLNTLAKAASAIKHPLPDLKQTKTAVQLRIALAAAELLVKIYAEAIFGNVVFFSQKRTFQCRALKAAALSCQLQSAPTWPPCPKIDNIHSY